MGRFSLGVTCDPLSAPYFYFFKNNFICLLILFLAVLGLHCCSGFSLVAVSRGYSLVVVCRHLIAVESLVEYRSRECGLSSCG